MAAGWVCYHCKQWVEKGEPHDCWTTTEAALTAELSQDLRDAWERLRETAVEFGEQRIYASHHSIMFSRTACYLFVRPKRNFLEVCLFLPRTLKSPQVRRVMAASKSKVAHLIQLRHRDEVEAPITDWMQEAYEFAAPDAPRGKSTAKPKPRMAPVSSLGKARDDPEPVEGSGVPKQKRPLARKKNVAWKAAKKR